MKNLFLSILSATVAISLFALLGFSEKNENGLIDLEAPVGSIVVWPGPQATIPQGWLLCNGDRISKNRYPELCQVILDYWGPISGLNNDIHKLPDLQGVFLRGANNRRTDNYSDPNKEDRVPSGNGESNEVGSFQLDEFYSHTHDNMAATDGVKARYGGGDGWEQGTYDPAWAYSRLKFNTNSGGKETRPKNAYINYIIKAQ
jgi:microcystin-dependent protein